MGFILVLMTVTLSLAGSAAFFSVYGLAKMFSGAFLPVIIMASSLEAGKLVAASFVYRYWNKISGIMKAYLITAILVLMTITSAGIFGFLSNAYQSDILPLRQIQTRVTLLKQEQQQLQARKLQIDNDIASLPHDFVTGRQRLMTMYAPELNSINKRLPQITTEIQTLESKKLTQEAHTGPIVFIAKAFGLQVNDATKYMILLIIFVFDPLAVVLTIGTNLAFVYRKQEKEEKEEKLYQRELNRTQPVQTIINEFDHVDDVHIEEETDNKEPIPDINTLSQLYEKLNAASNTRELSEEEQNKKAFIDELITKKALQQNLRRRNTPSE